MLPITASLMPAVRTRQALLLIDLQNDFLSPGGALPVTEPAGFVSRALKFVETFRNSGVGDIIWVRSEFEKSRTLSSEGDQIITSEVPAVPKRMASRSSRGRTPTPGRSEDAQQEADEEAFLSKADDDGKVCVIAGTPGAELAPQVQQAVDPSRDITITKTNYSAFASGQRLIQTLRGRFITEMYVCGALSNISIYATALDAGRHGYDMTIVEDCCGYRSEMRHINAMKSLGELLGTEPMTSQEILDIIQPKPKAKSSRHAPSAGKGDNSTGTGNNARQTSPVRAAAPTGLSPLISTVSLSSDLVDVPAPPPLISAQSHGRPPKSAPPPPNPGPPAVASRTGSKQPKSPKRKTEVVETAPLRVDGGGADESKDASPPAETDRDSRKRPADSDRSAQRETSPKSIRLPDRTKTASLKTAAPEVAGRSESSPVESCQDKEAQVKPAPKSIPEMSGKSEKPPNRDPEIAGNAAESTTTAKMNVKPDSPGPIASEPLGEGDTTIITNVLPTELAADAFERLKCEVSWAGMSHLGGEVPRRVAVQGEVDDQGTMPVYRHPSDESPQLLPFSPTVLEIKKATEKHLGHPLNHVLIQHYRSGNDYISEHSDKTLDIVRDSYIANVSLGAQRTMVFRTKRVDKDPSRKSKADTSEDAAVQQPEACKAAKPESKGDVQKRQVQRAALPHNSLCRMGLKTNERWLHAIKQDKRADRDKTTSELAYEGERISLTFRQIGTYLNATQDLIWGQGATGKTAKEAKAVVNGQTEEAVKMLQAFGNENHTSEFDWEARYGDGFNVVHMGTPKRFCRGPNVVYNVSIEVALAELGISYAHGAVADGIRFEDNDIGRAVVEDWSTTLLYLDGVYGPGRRHDQSSQADLAKRLSRFTKALGLLDRWIEVFNDVYPEAEFAFGAVPPKTIRKVLGTEIKDALMAWDKLAKEEETASEPSAGAATSSTPAFYIAGGDAPSIVDYALWPILSELVRMCDEGVLDVGGGYLAKYYNSFKARSTVMRVLNASLSGKK